MNFSDYVVDRLEPTDWKHVEKYPSRMLLPDSVVSAEIVLSLPRHYRPRYHQRNEGACVGFGWSWVSSINNRRLYDARWLYKEAQRIDEWPGENYSGTSVRAGGEVLRTIGHRHIWHGISRDPDSSDGISEYRWAQTVDEMRTAVTYGNAIVLGINWYTNFDQPEKVSSRNWIGRGDLGSIRGGHAICCYGASDRLQAFRLVNSWGSDYPLVWIPYETMRRMLDENGEAALVTDFMAL
jgi:hypothetical protein